MLHPVAKVEAAPLCPPTWIVSIHFFVLLLSIALFALECPQSKQAIDCETNVPMRKGVSMGQVRLLSGVRERRSSRRTSLRNRLVAGLVSANARLIAFVCFILLVALLGGSSRSDVPGLVVLRPLSLLFCSYALLVASREQLLSTRGPLLLIGSLMVLALLQLVPLPPDLWTSLPGRELVVVATGLVKSGDAWLPLSFDPSRTWNAFFALFVPLAGIFLVAAQGFSLQRRVLLSLAGIGVLGALLGFLQAIGGGGLYIYEITHRGYPVGLFANKNHQAILLLWLMLAASFFAATVDPKHRSAKAAVGSALVVIAVLFPLLILTGSRAGLLLCVPAMAGCGWLLLLAPATRALLKRGGRRAKLLFAGLVAVAVGLIAFVFTALALSSRQSALSRLFELSAGEDLRALYFERFLEMARDYLPFGSGLGSFEAAFNMYEPVEHLTPQYMNLAHNDPVQLVIEGGVLGAAIMIVGLLWLGRAGWRVWRSQGTTGPAATVFYCGSIALWLTASLVDYPLRTPLGATMFAALTAQLAILSTRGHSNTAAVDGRG